MKKICLFLFMMILLPILNVEALSCYGNTKEDAIDIDKISNFSCSGVEGDNLTFKHNEQDYSKYFSYQDGTVTIVDKSISFASSIDVGIVVVGDGKNTTAIFIKNGSYVKPTETTSTTTTSSNDITYTVTLDNNDNSEPTTKTCTVKKEGDTCSVTLPKIEKDYFTGWGKAKSCKEGSIGSIKVNENITYYACYSNNENISSELILKKLNITNNDESIDFGTFSMKKTDYEFKVLNEVTNLKIETEVDDSIEVTVEGNEELKVGENKIVITLKDKSNNTKTYNLNVTRLESGETINNIHYLKALVIGNSNIDFNKDKFNYDVTIPSDYNKLEINAISLNEEDSIEIKGNENLKNGSIITILVSGEDEEVTTYTLNIIKESSNILLFAAIGVIVLLIILLIVLLIVKSKNKKNKQTTKKQEPKTVSNNEIEVLNF